ncbi:MAG: hypothetical protein QOD77_1500 [Thermoplasmata archaeon]|jgi:hypothetical protein|nr:hypothetical protein [Thermoplasmata archaeon]
MNLKTALLAVLMLAATATPVTVADTSDVTACPVLHRLDGFALTGRPTPSLPVNVATAADPEAACAAIMGLRDAATCDGDGAACDPACLVDLGRGGAGGPSFPSPTPRGHADFNVAAVITTPCIDPATPYIGGGVTVGTLSDPLTINISGVCIDTDTWLDWRADVTWTADIGDATYTGYFPVMSTLAKMDITFDILEAGTGGIKSGNSVTGEGCELVKLGLMGEAYGEAIAWANSKLDRVPVDVEGSLGFLDSPNGPIVDLSGPGTGTVHVGYTLSRDVTTIGSVQWDFTALWQGELQCYWSVCAEGAVKSMGRSDDLVQLPLPILG